MAIAAVAGAWLAISAALWIGIAIVVISVVARRTWIVAVGIGCIASGLAGNATAALSVQPGAYRGSAEVVRATTTMTGDVRAEVRARVDGDRRHLDLIPTPRTRDLVARAQPGDRLEVEGRITPGDPSVARARGSHVAGRLHAATLAPGGPPSWPWRVAGEVRDTLRSWGGALPDGQRPLFEGFVLGDASGQTALQRADFRASGLTHLLVASGENIAFVLMLAAPVLRHVGMRGRWTITVGLCALYAMVTGLEPSVLRAAVMAIVAVTASGIGRPTRSWRSLALAVTALVLTDPFLVHSTAFGLSVGASTGIIALARPISDALPGPGWVREPCAVTVAAQVGVAPILLGFPGGMPVAALPANLFAAVPAGLVMVLGVPCLAIAATGLVGAGLLAWVPRILLGWVDRVATMTAVLGLGYLGALSVFVAIVAIALVLMAGRQHFVWVRRVGWALGGMSLLGPLIVGSTGAPAASGSGPVIVHRGGTDVVVLTGSVPVEQLLATLSVARVRDVEVIVVPRGDDADVAMLDAVAHRHHIGVVLAPRPVPSHRFAVTVVADAERLVVSDAVIEVVATAPVLSVHVEPGVAALERPSR